MLHTWHAASSKSQELEERMDLVQRVRTVNENRIAVLEDERDAALSECAGRDKCVFRAVRWFPALFPELFACLCCWCAQLRFPWLSTPSQALTL